MQNWIDILDNTLVLLRKWFTLIANASVAADIRLPRSFDDLIDV